jgi:hypothetical protein
MQGGFLLYGSYGYPGRGSCRRVQFELAMNIEKLVAPQSIAIYDGGSPKWARWPIIKAANSKAH